MLFLIAIVSFAAVSMTAWAVLHRRDEAILARLQAGAPKLSRERRLEGSAWQRVFRPGFRRFGHGLARLLPQNLIAKIDHMLVMANEPWPLHGFLTAWLIAIVLGLVLSIYFVAASSASGVQALMFTSILMLLAALAPYALLRRRVVARQKQILRDLPDAIDLLVTCVEAGVGVDAAFAVVVEKSRGPISETFAQYMRRVGLGESRRDALLGVANRTGVDDLISVANSINQGEDLGTTIGDILRAQSEDLRVRRRQRVQEAAQRAPVLMTIPIALCFLPAMGAIIVVPAILNLMNFIGGGFGSIGR
jgi:tight adherence protein C